MQVQINTDNNIEGSESLAQQVRGMVTDGLDRFSTQVTRVEVHLSDENSASKSGGDDKRCMLEARVAGLQPVSVSNQAPTLEQAVHGAVGKLQRVLDSTLGRLAEH